MSSLQKVYFRLNPTAWHGLHTESLWADPVPGSITGEVFVVKNSPFYTKEVSYLDVIRATPGSNPGTLDFVQRIDGEGHSTYRLLVQKHWDEFANYWQKLQHLGCTNESGSIENGMLYSVDVPQTTDIYKVYPILESGQAKDIWMFEEGHVGHELRS